MKNNCYLTLIALVLAFCVTGQAPAQEGTWSGKLQIGPNAIDLIFHFAGDSCTIDSPDQGVRGIAVKRKPNTQPTIDLLIPMIGASYKGVMMGKQIFGTFMQNGYEVPLTLKQGKVAKNRPQTPKGPFPYICEEISFANGQAVLKGTLTLPEYYNEQTPVLVMITGSGLQNRDEEVYEHKPFAVIADAFARKGIATLRYDDRGYGKSTGDVVRATTEDFKNDALAAIKLLRKRFRKIGVLGHSEGGTIGLMLAAEKQTDFVITLAAMAESGKEILLAQNQELLSLAGYSREIVEEYMHILEKLFDETIDGMKPLAENSSLLPDALNANLQQVAKMLSTHYMQYFLKLDARQALSDIQCPVLAMNGTKDIQVDCQKNLQILEKGIKSKQSKIVPCEGLNHLFQPCETGSANEYKNIEVTFATSVIDQMTEWIIRL